MVKVLKALPSSVTPPYQPQLPSYDHSRHFLIYSFPFISVMVTFGLWKNLNVTSRHRSVSPGGEYKSDTDLSVGLT